MPFVDLVERVEAGAPYRGVSIRLRGDVRPACIIGIRKLLGEQLKWKKGQGAILSLGQGDDAGKARIITRDDKHATAQFKPLRAGSGSFDFGHVEQFGSLPKIKVALLARMIDAKTIEIDLPIWADVPAPSEDDGSGDDDPEAEVAAARNLDKTPKFSLKPTTIVAPRSPAQQPAPERMAPADGVTHDGVQVTYGPPGIHHGGKSAQLTTIQARIAAALVSVMGKCLEMKSLVQRIYGNKAAPGDDEIIRQAIGMLHVPLAKVGLRITIVKGIGYTLSKS